MFEGKQQNLDRLIREAMEEKMLDSPEPRLSATEAWQKMERKRKAECNSSTHRFFSKRSFLAIAMVFIIFAFASYPQTGSAFSRWSELFSKAQGSVVQVFGRSGSGTTFESEGDETGFVVLEDSGPVVLKMSLEEAQTMTDFMISIPIVPSEFHLKEVTVLQEEDGKSNEVFLHYSSPKREFTVTEQVLEEQFAFGMTVDREDTTVEEIMINGQQASLIRFKTGVKMVTWMTQSHYFQIEGELTKEEIIKVAKSM